MALAVIEEFPVMCRLTSYWWSSFSLLLFFFLLLEGVKIWNHSEGAHGGTYIEVKEIASQNAVWGTLPLGCAASGSFIYRWEQMGKNKKLEWLAFWELQWDLWESICLWNLAFCDWLLPLRGSGRNFLGYWYWACKRPYFLFTFLGGLCVIHWCEGKASHLKFLINMG